MDHPSISTASKYGAIYPPPPRLHWAILLSAIVALEALVILFAPHMIRDFLMNLVIAAWPIYLCAWVRKINQKSTSLYWALASFVTGFAFSWILWIVVIFELREDLLEHYNGPEPIGLRLNWFMTLLFSFVYFQYHLRLIAIDKTRVTEDLDAESERFVIP